MSFTSNFEQSWQPVGEAIDRLSLDVHHHFHSLSSPYKIKRSVLPLQDFIYQMCVSKPSYCEQVYLKFKYHLEKHLELYADFPRDCNVIVQFNKIWKSYAAFLNAISKRIFCYLDRFFMAGMDQSSLVKAGQHIFARRLVNEEMVKVLGNSFIMNLGKNRDLLKTSDRQLLYFTDSIAILSPHTLHQFKILFFKETQQFYLFKSNQYRALTPFQYFNAINNLSFFQKMLLKMSLDLSTDEKLLFAALFEKNMVQSYTDIFIQREDGFLKVLQTKNYPFMKLITQVYSDFEGFEKLRKSYYDYLCVKGEKLMQKLITENNQDNLVNKFHHFCNEELHLVTEGFEKHQEMFVSMSNALEKIISKFETLPHILFRYSRKALDQNNFKEKSAKIKAIFDLIASKDEFIHLYERSLEDSIIEASNFNYIREKQFINFINEICGSQHTNRLQKKLEDFIQSNYKVEHEYSSLFSYKILGLHFWEKRFQDQIAIKLNLVYPLSEMWEKFSTIYLGELNKKKLSLLPFESRLILRIKLAQKIIDVKCNLFQACIILYASSKNTVNLSDLAYSLNIQKSLLTTFITLTQLLEQDEETITFKWDYNPQESIIEMNSKILYEQKFAKSVNQDRTILLEAHIVKMMKRKKQSSFEQIFQEISKKIQIFKPFPAMVKNTIQKLIKKDFLEESMNGLITYKQ